MRDFSIKRYWKKTMIRRQPYKMYLPSLEVYAGSTPFWIHHWNVCFYIVYIHVSWCLLSDGLWSQSCRTVTSLLRRQTLQSEWTTDPVDKHTVTGRFLLFLAVIMQDCRLHGNPGRLLEFYVRPSIFGMISWFMLWLLHHVKVNSCVRPNVFDIRLRTMTKSTWKILKLEWKTPGFFSSKRVGTLLCDKFFLAQVPANNWCDNQLCYF